MQFAAVAFLVARPMAAQDGTVEARVHEMYKKTYVDALPSLLDASAKLQLALGKKEEAEKLRALKADLEKGGDKPSADLAGKVMTVLSGSNKALGASLTTEGAKISDDQMQTFIDGASGYLDGAMATMQVAKLVPDLATELSGFQPPKNPMAARKAMGVVSVGKALVDNIPALAKGNVDTAKALKAYVTANKISVPAEKLNMDFGQ
jgi:hypothetical protein